MAGLVRAVPGRSVSADARRVERALRLLVTFGCEPSAALASAAGLDPESVVDAAIEHGVFGQVATVAHQHPDAWPELTAATHQRWLNNLAWSARALSDMHRAVRALHQSGIPFAVLKGPVLGQLLWGSPGLRTFTDLDLLVPKASRAAAAEALGLSITQEQFRHADLRDEGEIAATLPGHTPVDLHWSLINDGAIRRHFRFDTEALLDRARAVEFEDVTTPSLDREDTVLHVAVHMMASGGHRLGWYADLDRCMRDPRLDHDLLHSRAVDSQSALLLRVALERCRKHLDTPTPPALLRTDGAGARAWLLLGRLVDRAAPPGSSVTRPRRGQLYFRSTRETGSQSWSQLRSLLSELGKNRTRPVRKVVLISLESWDQVWRRNQHLASRIAAQHHTTRILFVEPSVPGLGTRRREVLPGVFAYRPSLMVPKRLGGLRAVGWSLRLRMRRSDVLWVNDPQIGVHVLSARYPAIYDVTDDWREFRQPRHIVRRIVEAEDRLATAGRTVVCSRVLSERWEERYGIEPVVIRNGVDTAGYAAATPVDLGSSRSRIGYVGTQHEERLDLGLLRDLASADLGQLFLIGPSALSADQEAELRAHGVALVGAVPSADVPRWMKAMDVLISPHLVTPFTLSLDAIKSYEYLAANKPIVATPTSGFHEMDAPNLAVTPREGFLEAVRVATLTTPTEIDASPYDWATRAAEMWEALTARR